MYQSTKIIQILYKVTFRFLHLGLISSTQKIANLKRLANFSSKIRNNSTLRLSLAYFLKIDATA